LLHLSGWARGSQVARPTAAHQRAKWSVDIAAWLGRSSKSDLVALLCSTSAHHGAASRCSLTVPHVRLRAYTVPPLARLRANFGLQRASVPLCAMGCCNVFGSLVWQWHGSWHGSQWAALVMDLASTGASLLLVVNDGTCDCILTDLLVWHCVAACCDGNGHIRYCISSDLHCTCIKISDDTHAVPHQRDAWPLATPAVPHLRDAGPLSPTGQTQNNHVDLGDRMGQQSTCTSWMILGYNIYGAQLFRPPYRRSAQQRSAWASLAGSLDSVDVTIIRIHWAMQMAWQCANLDREAWIGLVSSADLSKICVANLWRLEASSACSSSDISARRQLLLSPGSCSVRMISFYSARLWP
jgi:hypothetical protein